MGKASKTVRRAISIVNARLKELEAERIRVQRSESRYDPDKFRAMGLYEAALRALEEAADSDLEVPL